MNQQMYRAAATQANLQTLQARGMLLWGPDSGSQPAATSARAACWIRWTLSTGERAFLRPAGSATFAGYDHRRPDA